MRLRFAPLVFATLLGTSASALHADEVLRGKQKAATACAACHGPDGIAKLPGAPHLAGQPQEYLAAQLEAYRSGRRAHEIMGVVARTLGDADIAELSAWFASIEVGATPTR